MVANIIAVAVLVLWTALTVRYIWHEWKTAKENGTGAACVSCASFKAGTCNHSCTTEADVDRMVAAAKAPLAARE